MTKLEDTVKKIVVGLRGIADVLTAESDRDRINGYAAELAQAIGYVEPTPDLLAARELAASVITQTWRQGRCAALMSITGPNGAVLFTDDLTGCVARIRRGDADTGQLVTNTLAGIAEGRRLAEQEAADLRTIDMMTAPPERLTITVDGPQGSGKTRLAHWVNDQLCGLAGEATHSVARLAPTIVEMREGRPFDVRNETFIS